MNTQYNKKNNTSFKAVTFEDYNNKFYSIKSKLQKELNRFAAGADNAEVLGDGKFGETFKFTTPGLTNIVIKRPKNKFKDDYKQEYDNLVQVPVEKVGGQAGVARAYDSRTRKYYLMSTLTDGKEVSPANRYSSYHLKSLFNKMFELDKVGFYHGDLNGKNILLTDKGEINFIDYQWSQIVNKANFFDAEKSKKLLLPLSNFPENAQMFEMATMPYYLEKIGTQSEKEAFLKIYLQNKANYHENRYNYIKKITQNWPYYSERPIIQNALENEKAKAKVYKNPTDNILRIELKKFQFLSDYRDAYGHVDPNILDRNILASSSSYLCSISAVQDYRKEIAKQLLTCRDSDLRRYLTAQMEYGDYWFSNLRTFSSDTFDYVMRAITKNMSPEEEKYRFYIENRNPRHIKENKNILEAMNSRFHTSFDRNFEVPYNIENKMHNVFSIPMRDIKNEIGEDIKAYHRCKKVQNAYKELKDFNRQGRFLDLLNVSELISLKAREFYGYTYHNMSSVRLDRILDTMRTQAANLTENIYHTILNGLSEFNANAIKVQGYKDMRKFLSKI